MPKLGCAGLVEDGKAEKESMLDAWATTTTQPAEAPGSAAVEQLPIRATTKGSQL